MVKARSSLGPLLPSTPQDCLPSCLSTLQDCPAVPFKTSLLMELCALLPVSPPSSGYHTEEGSTPDCLSPLLDWESLEDELERLLSSDEHRHLLTPSPSPLPLHSFISYSTSSSQPFLCMKDVTFYIGAEGPATLRDLEQAAVTIVGPTGRSLPVLQFTSLSDSVAVTFRPFIPGFHTIEVFHGVELIKGCPAQMLISRNYTEQPLRAVVSWDQPVISRKPWGLSCNTNTEQLWMADREQNEILVFLPDGSLDFSFGRPGTAPGEFCRPTAIAYDASMDRFLITDKDNHRVQMFSPQGDLLGCFGSYGSMDGQFKYPWGIAISPDGSLIAVADSRNHRIQFFNPDGSFLRQFRVADRIPNWKQFKNIFDYPRGLAFDLTGSILYITDFNLHTVFQLHVHTGIFAPLVSPGILHRPSGLAVDNAGNLLVADNKHHSLQLFSPDGVHLSTISTLSSSLSSHNFHQPTDVTIMKAGHIALLDFNSRITIF